MFFSTDLWSYLEVSKIIFFYSFLLVVCCHSFFGGNMAQALKEVLSSQKFLSGIRALPHYGQVEQKQSERLRSLIGKGSISVEMAGRLLEVLDPEVWSTDNLSSLKAVIADQTAEATETVRAKQQDYRTLPRILPASWWKELESRENSIDKLVKLVHLTGKLGLRSPTEGTNGTLIVLAFYSVARNPWLESDKQSLLQRHRGRIKKILDSFPTGGTLLDVLPDKVEDLSPELRLAAFPQGWDFGQPTVLTMDEVEHHVNIFALRKNHRAVASTGLVSASSVPGLDTAAIASATAAAMFAAQRMFHTEDPPLPGFKMLKGNSTATDGSSGRIPEPRVLALPAPPDPTEHSQMDTKDSEEPTPLQIVAELQAGLKEGSKTTDETGSHSKMKRPAAKASKPSKVSKSSKKPSGITASGSKKPSRVLKRPSSQAVSVLGPQEIREALFKKIPKTLQDKYRGGCARCRERPYCTVSCWRLRGYSV